MKLKGVVYEDFANYKEPSMFLAFPFCTFKCEKECGIQMCQNRQLSESKLIEIEASSLVKRFLNNQLTKSIVCGGLEPMDSFEDLFDFIFALREATDATVVIYTGYKEEEIEEKTNALRLFGNIIIKFGRFVPNQASHYDEILGVSLASPNQYAKRIS